MIAPHELNKRTSPDLGNEFPISWLVGHVKAAWENDPKAFQNPLPIAIQPTAVHQRMTAQRSCFTIQGKDPHSLTLQVPNLLKRYDVEATATEAMQSDLRLLGVDHSTVFPDLDRLAKELSELY